MPIFSPDGGPREWRVSPLLCNRTENMQNVYFHGSWLWHLLWPAINFVFSLGLFHCICFLFPVWKWFTGNIYAQCGNPSRWLDKAVLHSFRGESVGTGSDCFWFTFETKLTTALAGEGGVCPRVISQHNMREAQRLGSGEPCLKLSWVIRQGLEPPTPSQGTALKCRKRLSGSTPHEHCINCWEYTKEWNSASPPRAQATSTTEFLAQSAWFQSRTSENPSPIQGKPVFMGRYSKKSEYYLGNLLQKRNHQTWNYLFVIIRNIVKCPPLSDSGGLDDPELSASWDLSSTERRPLWPASDFR